jgi:uncharacterized protein (DUF4415 family)
MIEATGDTAMTAAKKKTGRPPSGKRLLTLRLEPEVVEFYRAYGAANNPKGWLQEVNDTLRQSMQARLMVRSG